MAHHKIKVQTMEESWLINAIFFLLIWVVIKWFPTLIDPDHSFSTGSLFAFFWTVAVFGVFFLLNWLSGEQSINEAILFVDRLTNGMRATKSILFFKALSEKIAHRIDLEASTVADKKGTFATKDQGKAEIAIFIIAKADYPDDPHEATESMVRYISMEPDARVSNLYTLAHNLLRPICAKNAVSDLSGRDDLLTPAMLQKEATRIGMKIWIARGYDLDLDEAGQQARSAIIKANAMADARVVMFNAGFSPQKADEAALLVVSDKEVTKQILEINGIPENLFAPLAAIQKFANTVAPVTKMLTGKTKPSPKPSKK